MVGPCASISNWTDTRPYGRAGTIISIMKSGAKMLAPIYSRLNTSETILREKEDASMLLQALLDLSKLSSSFVNTGS